MTTPRIAVYAGSFDPFTNGHLDITRRAASLFDELVVAVGDNPGKRYLLSLEQRMAVSAAATADIAGVSVDSFGGLLVDYCARIGASVIVRGLRSGRDLDFEMPIGMANRDMAPGIETVFLLSAPESIFISSSIVREIATYGGSIDRYVSPAAVAAVAAALARRG
ncbi:MAG: pantetheine-phosphate adenylyltransferase [Myxococcota bacterium]|jgi:pantetheine-phosphate adenylyltransferase